MVRRSAFRGRLRQFDGIDEITLIETTILISMTAAIINIDNVLHRLDRLDALLIGQDSRVCSDSEFIAAEIASVD